MKAFVLMPFAKDYDDVYKIGIQEVALLNNIKAERLDEQMFASDMMIKIYTEIEDADFIIADMSSRNPNVFYEVGYADARKKLVILLTNNADDIPFDFKHRPHIIYNNISDLKKQLDKSLKWAKGEVENRNMNPLKSEIEVKDSYLSCSDYNDIGYLFLKITIYNLKEIDSGIINSIYLFTGEEWVIKYKDKTCDSNSEANRLFPKRHIVIPEFKSIPSNDNLFVDIVMEKTFYAKWRKTDMKKDKYLSRGTVKIDINTDNKKYSETHDLAVEFVEIPF